MTADEAKKLTQEAWNNKEIVEWPEILSSIRNAAYRGETVAVYFKVISVKSIKKLEELGYQVSIYEHPSENYTKISW